MTSFSFKKAIFILLFLIIAFDFLALKNFWYWKFLWLDMAMHFSGGLWVAMVYTFLISKYEIKTPIFFNFIFGISFVALIGVLWEITEFLRDLIFQSAPVLQLGASDTISDLFFDLLGAAIFLIIYRLMEKKGN